MSAQGTDVAIPIRAPDEFSAPMEKAANKLQEFAAEGDKHLSRFEAALGKVSLAYGRFAEDADQAIQKVSRQTSTGAKEVGLIAKQIVDSVQQTGNIDLGLDRIAQQLNAARGQVAVLEDMRAAQVRLVGSTDQATSADKLRLATLDQSIERARQNITVLEQTSGAMERMQADLRANGTALAEWNANQTRGTTITGQTRAGLQQLSYQLNDVAVQYAAGTPPAVIFAQQSGQVAQAVGLIAAEAGTTSGVLGRFAGFLGGPWGLALTSAVVVMSPFIAKLFETGEAADNAKAKVYGLKQALADLRTKPMESLGQLNTNVLKAESALRAAKNAPGYTGGGSDAYKRNTKAEKDKQKAIADAQAELDGANMELRVAQAVAKTNESLFEITAKAGKSRARDIKEDKGGASGGGSGRKRTSAKVEDAAKKARDEIASAQAALDDLKKDMRETGLFASTAERGDITRQIRADDAPPLINLPKVSADLDNLHEHVVKLKDESKIATVEIAKSFGDMADDTLAALDRMASAIQGGGFLNILRSVLGFGLQLGKIGVFGPTVQTNINSAQKKATGGRIFGPGTGTSDEVPIWASHGEYIVNAKATAQFLPALEAINSGRIPKLAHGGMVSPSLPASMRRGVGGGGASTQGGDTYYLQGNLLTPEWWAQINAGHAVAAQAGGELGYRKVVTKGRRRLA